MQRELSFQSIDDILAELDRLTAGEPQTTGLWSPAQIFEHLSEGVRWAMNQPSPGFTTDAPILSSELGRKFYERMVRAGKMRQNVQNPNAPTEREDRPWGPALQDFRKALGDFRDYAGPHPIHAFFGELTSAEWQTWNLIHCAHHLGFVRQADD